MTYLTAEELAYRFRVPLRTVYAWRQTHYGPVPLKIGKHLRYPLDAVTEFEHSLS